MKENENKVKDYMNKLIDEYNPTPLTEEDEEYAKQSNPVLKKSKKQDSKN